MARRDASPGFLARVERPFYIGRYEVTQAEWRRVMGSSPSTFRGDRHPVEGVSWADAREFVRRLDRLDPGARHRLPTELEWEYAARAGAEGEMSWAEIGRSAWIAQADKGSTHPVGGKQPNAWGLYDTLGNVWEWVEDHYNARLFPDPTVTPPSGEHVLRGGGFLSDVKNATYATHAGGPGSRFDVGFRVVREVR
jgi:formylglycine-generating enzyme required for sulfatase activity